MSIVVVIAVLRNIFCDGFDLTCGLLVKNRAKNSRFLRWHRDLIAANVGIRMWAGAQREFI